MKKIAKFKKPLVAFIATFVILVTAFALRKLFPFGDKQIMIIDSWHQYYPILQHLQYKLKNGQSIFYTFNSGAGTNFFLMMSYYAMSPLNLLSLFCPSEYMREFMAFITMFKLSLAAFTFTYYLQEHYQKQDLSVVIFGIAFAFSGFFMGYYWNLMWLDVAAVMPLAILGLRRIVDAKGNLLYILSLAYALIANYYAAYFLCLFIFFYSFVLLYLKTGYNLKAKFIRLLVIGWHSLLAILLAAITLSPVFEGMSYAYALSSKNPDKLKLYQPIMDVLARFYPYVEPTSIDGLPNLSLSALALLLVGLYFVATKIDIKAKVANGALIVFLIVSTIINYLDFFWHAFHFPNQVPYRFTFVLIFLLFTIAYETFINLDVQSEHSLVKVFAVLLVFVIVNQKIDSDAYYQKAALAAMLSLLLYLILLLLYKRQSIERRTVLIILAVFMMAESFASIYFAIEANRVSTRTGYPENKEDIEAAIEYINEKEDEFCRMEVSSTYTANDPLLYNYHGITQFSSTANAGFNAYTRSLGLSASPGSNSFRYFPNTPIANGFLNLKYLIDKDKLRFSPAFYQLEEKFENENIQLYKNKYPLPFGFSVSRDIYDYKPKKSHPFNNQEELLHLATGLDEKIFTHIEDENIEVKPTNIKDIDIKNIAYHYKNINKNNTAKANVEVTFPKNGYAYAYVKNSHKKVKVDYETLHKTYDPRKGVVIALGEVKANTTATFDVTLKAQKSGYFDFDIVYIDVDMFEFYYNILSATPFELEKITDTEIIGNINMPADSSLYLSLPLDDGWNLTVDGKAQSLNAIEEGVVLIDLDKGEHRIEMTYRPLGLTRGMLLSLLALILIILTTKFKTKLVEYIPVLAIVTSVEKESEPEQMAETMGQGSETVQNA